MRQLGLFTPELQNQLHPYKKLKARDGLNNFFMDLSVSEDGWQTYGAHRGLLYEALLDSIRKSALEERLQLRLGTDIDQVQRVGQRWQLRSGTQDLGEFDLVVIADGSRSRNRQRFGLRCLHFSYDIGAMWFMGRSAQPSGELLQSCQGTSRLIGLLPTDRQEHVSFFYACSAQEYHTLLGQPFEAFIQRVEPIAPEAVSLLQQAKSFESFLHTKYRHGWMPSWIGPGVVVIGDAAHPMSPHLGQGINLALMDAYTLAKSLDHCEIGAALIRHQSKRRPQIALNSWLSLILTPFFQSRPDWGQGHLRNLGVRLFSAWPWMHDQMQGAVWGRKAALWNLLDDFETIC